MKLKLSYNIQLCLRYFSGFFLAILLAVPIQLQAQNQQTIKGVILDTENGKPLADVSVVVKKSGKGTVTDASGGYSITAGKGDVLVFSEQFKHFLKRTEKQYTRSGLNYLPDRGIENRLLDSLLQYLPDGAIIAGGFALSMVNNDKNSNDIDFFF